jgi:hypothetical protein
VRHYDQDAFWTVAVSALLGFAAVWRALVCHGFPSVNFVLV